MPNAPLQRSARYPLLGRLPAEGRKADPSLLLECFLEYLDEKKLSLYPAQEEAILALFEGKNVILNTPTGSGKSLVATALHFYALARGRRSYYTCPIKALVNEKFLALCHDFGPENVGMATGDATVNRDAKIICCTAEILSNLALREGEMAPVEDVVMDEFHYYSDRERGVAWQVPLLTLNYSRFLLMSATLGDVSPFEKGLAELTQRETVVVRSGLRPVPLDFIYKETPLHETIKDLVFGALAPVYLVNFTQREAAEEAQNLLSVDVCSKEEKKALAEAMEGMRFSSPYGKEMQKLLRHGIGLHHAGLLPKYRLLVERLAQRGMLKVISGTDTLGVGVNVPIRTVLFSKLCKFDGEKTTILSVRDFQQISGRAGRKGFDDRGTVVAQAPAHVIENLRLEAKNSGDPRKMRKVVKARPPEKGFLPWDAATFRRLIESPPEALQSRFGVSHGMLLNVLSRSGDGFKAMRDLIRASHETPVAKRKLRRTAFQLFRSLLARGIVELKPLNDDPGERGVRIQVNLNLQQDFSLNQTLSLWLLDIIKLLDAGAPDYALDLLTLVESILENPELILRKQLDRIKTERLADMKMQGIEYEERMAELEKLEYPKPLREFIYDTFNKFAAEHPWVGQENIRPKSIAREMFEHFRTFDEYVRDYELQRSEGLLLRYLSEVYKVLVQTVPEYSKDDEVFAIIAYFGTMLRGVDSSLLDEWERMRNPAYQSRDERAPAAEEAVSDITRDKRSFTVLVRNELFRIIRALALRDFETAAGFTGGEIAPDTLATLMAPYFAEHRVLSTDRRARDPKHLSVRVEEGFWELEQILTDPEEHNDWMLEARVDLAQSRLAGAAVVRLLGVRPV